MKSEAAEVETEDRSVRGKTGPDEILEVQGAGSKRARGVQRNSGLPHNWVKPWLTMSNSAMVTCQCDWHELKKV